VLAAPPEARCATHPAQVAELVCERCGAFACPDCAPVGRNRARWHRCTPERVDPSLVLHPSPPIATVAVILGAGSLVPCLGLVLTPGALVSGLASLRYEPTYRRRASAGLALTALSALGHLAAMIYLGATH